MGRGQPDQKREGCACGMPVTFDPEAVVLPVIRHLTEGASKGACYPYLGGPPATLPLGTETRLRKNKQGWRPGTELELVPLWKN